MSPVTETLLGPVSAHPSRARVLCATPGRSISARLSRTSPDEDPPVEPAVRGGRGRRARTPRVLACKSNKRPRNPVRKGLPDTCKRRASARERREDRHRRGGWVRGGCHALLSGEFQFAGLARVARAATVRGGRSQGRHGRIGERSTDRTADRGARELEAGGLKWPPASSSSNSSGSFNEATGAPRAPLRRTAAAVPRRRSAHPCRPC